MRRDDGDGALGGSGFGFHPRVRGGRGVPCAAHRQNDRLHDDGHRVAPGKDAATVLRFFEELGSERTAQIDLGALAYVPIRKFRLRIDHRAVRRLASGQPRAGAVHC